MNAQAANLERVRQRLDPVVLEFCRAHIGAPFHMEELVRFTHLAAPGSPDSPSRVLRRLRSLGFIAYRVMNRAQSLYIVDEVRDG